MYISVFDRVVLYMQQIQSFIVVGVLATLVHLTSLYVFVDIVNLSYSTSNLLGFVIAFQINFLGNFFFTFNTKEDFFQRDKKQTQKKVSLYYLKWFISSILVFFCNQTLFIYSIKHFGEKNYIFIWLIITLIMTFVSFISAKLWAFNSRKNKV